MVYMRANEYLDKAKSDAGRVDKRSIARVIKQYNLQLDHLSTDQSEAFFLFVNGLNLPPKSCKVCGGRLAFHGFKNPYPREHCSTSCAAKSNLVKSKETCLQRYGVPHHMKVKTISEKVAQTTLERYGNKTVLSTDIATAGMIEKYGTPHISQTESWRKKTEQTFEKRYNGRGFSGDLRQKSEERLRAYLDIDFDAPWHQLVGWSHVKRSLESKSDFEIQSINYKEDRLVLKHKCGNIIDTVIQDRNRFRCLACEPITRSKFEDEVAQFVNSLKIEVVRNDRTIIAPLELDIYIPSLNIAIECNGDYWHSYSRLETVAEQRKHLDKLEACNALGIGLIQIAEHEWVERRDIIMSILSVRLGKATRKIGARRLELKQIPNGEANKFCEEHHIQGKAGASWSFGALLEDELVAVYTVGKNRFTKSGYELIRFANLKNTVTPGLFTRLNNFALTSLGIDQIESYLDRRIFSGASLKKSGWKLSRTSKPGYCWIFNGRKVPRSKTQKHRLGKILGDRFFPALSESENMFAAGARRLWDCGQFVFEFTRNDKYFINTRNKGEYYVSGS